MFSGSCTFFEDTKVVQINGGGVQRHSPFIKNIECLCKWVLKDNLVWLKIVINVMFFSVVRFVHVDDL